MDQNSNNNRGTGYAGRGRGRGRNRSGGGGRTGQGGGSYRPQHTQALRPDIESLQISEKKPPLDLSETTENRIVPINRPDKGGTDADRKVWLLANHFIVSFKPEDTILHYRIDIEPQMSRGPQPTRNFIPKMDHRRILNKLFSDDLTRLPDQKTAYDGMKFIFSKVPLPTGQFGGEDMENHRSPIFTITLVNELSYAKLKDYISGNHRCDPRDILQGMDLVMKENPSSQRISVGRSFYSRQFRQSDDLGCGIAAFRGFQQSLKPTSQGLALCLDHSAMAFCKHMPVIDFLMEHVWGFQEVNDVGKKKRDVAKALRGLNVYVTHRNTKQKFLVAGLSKDSAREISFTLENHEPPRETGLVEYFWETYNKKILYDDIPCLDLGRSKSNYVPVEFCTLVEGQRYPKEKLHREDEKRLKDISMPRPRERKSIIYEMVQAKDGPCGNVVRNFGIAVDKNMTRVVGRVLAPPTLTLRTPAGNPQVISVDRERCQWNLTRKSVMEGKPLKWWALIDFSVFDRFRLNSGRFIQKLRKKCSDLGIPVEEPVVCRFTGMRDLSSVAATQKLLDGVVKEANGKCNGRLQLFVCVMSEKHDSKKYLKWVSETRIGIMTQCCLVKHANNPKEGENDQYLSNLALKINAKLGGSNMELVERLPGFPGEEHVMFIGADVNHPAPRNTTCPSFAGVVATTNWPAVSRYVVRLCAQEHRKERIVDFGATCLDLVNTYARLNKVKPQKIVVFRDGVSEGQFDMVLNEELQDMKSAIYEDDYRPTITLVVTQKRHLTRMFVENERDGGRSGNVPPGTVVDTKIVHPFHFDFYLCSQHGAIGTSKAAHYNVLWDEHNFTSDQIQKLVYHLCFTSARCTKPVSLVPPVFYADLVAFRGRLYHDAAMESQPQSAASPSSSSAALLNEGFYKVHPYLKNEMFFV
ncbi:protein argonaute 2-like [Rhododendron vialii]|uniref:protein argonaute 2-like n=1 Tax=Rhododendron vialii TaxID=182163 RepID=UPI0026600C79|nr:protein argonaute 2-like [Rhododendron vialii]